jgi:hypothetical protein
MTTMIEKQARELLARARDVAGAVITEAQLGDLLDPIRRYLDYALVVGKEPIRTVRLKQRGAMVKEAAPAAQQPRLTFACELDPTRLTALFSDGSVIADLQALGAHVALMLSDLSPERAAIVKQLNAAGVPVVAVPLLPLEGGYYFTADNASEAAARYDDWKAWTAQHGLVWERVGLDIEPDARIYQQIMDNPWGLVPLLLPRLWDTDRPRRAQAAYATLIERIHADGFPIENYQFPLIADERWAGTTLLQRLLGLVEVRTDREVWMLYTSVFGSIGPGILWTYAPEAAAIGVGSTGGGPDIPGHPQVPALDWEAFARDLRMARQWCDNLLIHSLEGCVRQGFLTRLRSFDWEAPIQRPGAAPVARGLRRVLRGVLWASAHPRSTAVGAVAMLGFLSRHRRAL